MQLLETFVRASQQYITFSSKTITVTGRRIGCEVGKIVFQSRFADPYFFCKQILLVQKQYHRNRPQPAVVPDGLKQFQRFA